MPVVTLLDCLVEDSTASSVYEFSTIIITDRAAADFLEIAL